MVEERIVETLKKVLALTTSSVEGEAQAAAGKLADLLTKYNLSIADLETQGQTGKPQVKEEGYDLGKAAFTWKLNLAEKIAQYYYCYSMVNRKDKTVRFVGRPDNVESLQMLYRWLIDQIKKISSTERKIWMENEQKHIDPLRWQVNFGIGAANRLKERLEEKAEQEETVNRDVRALVVHHKAEISNYLEKIYGFRTDGQQTEAQKKWTREYGRRKELKERDIEEYYKLYPWDKPLTDEQREKQDKIRRKQEKAREKRRQNRKDRPSRAMTDEEYCKYQQGQIAKSSGHKAGDKINLEPFVEHEQKEQLGG